MDITVIGAGFVGVTTATVLAEEGHDVSLVEKDPRRLAALQAGFMPFHEPGLDDAFGRMRAAGRIHVLAAATEATGPDLVFLCVGTPALADGHCDTSYIEAAAAEVAGLHANRGRPLVVAVKSTVPPGTTRTVVVPALDRGGLIGDGIDVAMVPEFLKEGSALADARCPDRIVIGHLGPLAKERLATLFQDAQCPVHITTLETAELVKYASNAMLAIRIAFANEIGRVAEAVGTDVDEVMGLVGLDARIGPRFLQAGPGFGGSCFPKDLRALAALGRGHGVRMDLTEAAIGANDLQPSHVVERAAALVGGLAGAHVAILGVAFKADTSDVRETRALPIHDALVAQGARVVCHDPMAIDAFRALAPHARTTTDIETALTGADLLILHTDWPHYTRIDPTLCATLMRRPLVLDCRRVLDAGRFEAVGVQVAAIGRGAPTAAKRPLEVTP